MKPITNLTHCERIMLDPATVPEGTIVYETDTERTYALYKYGWVDIESVLRVTKKQ